MVTLNNERLYMSPAHKRMQMSVVRVEPGLAILSMPLSEDLRGYFEGSIHGGMLATFADAASASCLAGNYDVSTHFTVTTDIHVRYYRQPKGGPLVAEAKLVHAGRRLLSTDCSVVDAQDRVLVRTTATFMLVPNTNPL
ncbi:MAG: PaaI family thioesterase [Mycobacterium sp.]